MIFTFVQKATFAQGQAAVPFLLIAPDSRAGAMGESGGGLANNSAAIFWNPAGIAFLDGAEVSVTHSNWLPQFNVGIFYDYLTFRDYIPDINGSITSSVTYMNYGQFVRTSEFSPTPIGTFDAYDMAFTVGYATKLSADWGIGFNLRLIHSQLSDQPTANEQGHGTATTVSFDVATMWRPAKFILPFIDYDLGKKFSVGVNLSNLGPKIYYIDRAQADPLPTNFRLGIAWNIFSDQYNSLMYTLDFSKELISTDSSKQFYQAIFTSWADRPFNQELQSIATSMGFEYWYGTPGDFLFALRMGYFYEDPSYGGRKFMSFGAGIRYDIYGFDFSYLTTSMFQNGDQSPLNNTLRFTISIGWGGTVGETRGLPRGI
jgi:hypothetical protein